MDTTVTNIRIIQTELDRLKARRQYLLRAVRLLKNDDLVDVTTDETTLRYAVYSLNNLITANDVFMARASQQLADAIVMHESISKIEDQREKQNVTESFEEELCYLVEDITEQRNGMTASIHSTKEILCHFLEDTGRG